jgi:hypothetical protein
MCLGMNVRACWRLSFQSSPHDATSYMHENKKRVHILPGVRMARSFRISRHEVRNVVRRLCKVHHVGKQNGLTDTAENASKCNTSNAVQRSERITLKDEYWGAKRSDRVETRE